MTSISTFSVLMVTCILIAATLVYLLNKKRNNQLITILSVIFELLLIWIIGLILQICFSKKLNISPIYFDYFVYISICFLPLLFLFLSMSFTRTKFKFMKKHLLLFIIPIVSLIVLWTNDFHHLFYEVYSTNQSETVFGNYFYIHTLYTYSLFVISFITLFRYSIKNSGFFSKQALLILLGSFFPIIVNVLGLFNVTSMNIYMTPISFTLTVLCYMFAIFKFDFLKIAPIALQKIVDRMSDAYIIVNDEQVVTDFNKTFIDLFNLNAHNIRYIKIGELLNKISSIQIDNEFLLSTITSMKKTSETVRLEKHFVNINKYFNIEINSITNKDSFLGTLILLKDITQHVLDIRTIKENQETLIEKERLATLGQMIGRNCSQLKNSNNVYCWGC